jgi:hypothetical protein
MGTILNTVCFLRILASYERRKLINPSIAKLPFDYPGCKRPIANTHVFSSSRTEGSVIVRRGNSNPDNELQSFVSDKIVSI